MKIKAPRMFTGREWLSNRVVELDDGEWTSLDSSSSSPVDLDVSSGFLCPSFVDVQVYGGHSLLFSNRPTVESIQATADEHLQTGTTHFQITLNCSPWETMKDAISSCKTYMQNGGKGLVGLHLEGPFFAPSKRGAHVLEFVRTPDRDFCRRVVQETEGLPTYMTIAPEVFDKESLSTLMNSPIMLSIGHSDATFEQATEAFNAGISRVTHLFNAQSQWTSRALGIVGAAMDHPAVRASVVADGLHVDFAGIRLAKKLMGDRLFLITDAVTEDVSGPYFFSKSGGIRFTDENGVLSGSALTMDQAVRNCVEKVGIPLEESLRMASLYPAEVLGLDDKLGTIEVGKEASFLWLSDDLKVKGVWRRGRREV